MESQQDLRRAFNSLTIRKDETSNRSYYQLSMDFGTVYSAAAARYVEDVSNSGSQKDTQDFIFHNSFIIDKYPGPTSAKRLTEEALSTVVFQDGQYVNWDCEREDYEDDDGVDFFDLLKMVFDETKRGKSTKEKILNQCHNAGLNHIEMISKYLKAWYDFCVDRIEAISNDRSAKIIQVIFSAPASWTSLAKQEMREAAELAGITLKEGDIHPEPQAVAAFLLEKNQGLDVEAGDVILVHDAGGGTSDSALLEIQSRNPLKMSQVAPIDGDSFGSIFLDKKFEMRLRQRVGHVTMGASKIERGIRIALTQFKNDSKTKYGIGGNREMIIRFSGLQPDSSQNIIRNHVVFSGSECSDIFDPIVKGNIALIVKQLKMYHSIMERENKPVKRVKYIFFVGGLSGSPYVERAIRTEFNGGEIMNYPIPVMTPSKDGATAVAQGALLLSSNQLTVKDIRFPYGYAIVQDEKWDQSIHGDQARKHLDRFDNCWRVKDRVQVLIQKEEKATYTQTTPYVRKSRELYFDQDPKGSLKFKVPIWRCSDRVENSADLEAVKNAKGISLVYDLHIDLSDATHLGVLSYNARGKLGVRPCSELKPDASEAKTVWQNTRSAKQRTSNDSNNGPAVRRFYRFWFQVVARYVGSDLIFEVEVPPGGAVLATATLKPAEDKQG